MTVRFRCAVSILLGITAHAARSFAQVPPPAVDAPAAAAASTPLSPAEQAPPPPPPVVDEVPPPRPTATPLKIEGPNGNSVRFGLLLQPQFQAVSSPTLSGYNMNLFLRRARIIVGGTLFGTVEYFIDTDYPNLFLDNTNTAPAGMPPVLAKNTPGMNIQDAFATVKLWGDMLKVDAGYMLPPLAHNAVQGAGTLYGWDYYAYSFQQGNAFGSSGNPVGRDLGVELRGLVAGGHVEYRAGLFQGLRDQATATDSAGRNFFRATGRIQINLLDAETGFFYAGSYLGAKKILSIGGSVDYQDKYKYFAGDVFADLPLGPGVFTGQVNVIHLDGGSTLAGLAKQTAEMGEIGYDVAGVDVSPIFRLEHISGAATSSDGGAGPATTTRYAGGVAYWAHGHNTNVKLFYTRIQEKGTGGAPDPKGVNQINLQLQVYYF